MLGATEVVAGLAVGTLGGSSAPSWSRACVTRIAAKSLLASHTRWLSLLSAASCTHGVWETTASSATVTQHHRWVQRPARPLLQRQQHAAISRNLQT